jgi:hypothetical protein
MHGSIGASSITTSSNPIAFVTISNVATIVSNSTEV